MHTVDMFEDDQELKEQARIARLKKEEEEREAKLAAKEGEKLRKQKEKEEKERRKREAGPSWIQRKIDSLTKEIFSDDDMKMCIRDSNSSGKRANTITRK